MTSSVLTISSHVIHGYVGNKAIIFPLQYLGWDVDNINTVNYSNHTGYGTFKGTQLSVLVLRDLLTNLLNIDITKSYKPEFIITGYFPNDGLIQQFQQFLVQYKSSHSQLIYLLDPILGDQNQLYVDKSCIGQFQLLVSTGLVDIITPNQFELQLLTDTPEPITDDFSLVNAINKLKIQAPLLKFIVVTSYVTAENPNDLYCVFTTNSTKEIYYYKVPLLKGYFTGVGDLFSGLIIDKLHKNYYSKTPESKDDLKGLATSINQVLSIMSDILTKTYDKGFKLLGRDITEMGNLEIGAFELDLIDSKLLFSSTGQYYQFNRLETLNKST